VNEIEAVQEAGMRNALRRPWLRDDRQVAEPVGQVFGSPEGDQNDVVGFGDEALSIGDVDELTARETPFPREFQENLSLSREEIENMAFILKNYYWLQAKSPQSDECLGFNYYAMNIISNVENSKAQERSISATCIALWLSPGGRRRSPTRLR
jgi:hypothetical protein